MKIGHKFLSANQAAKVLGISTSSILDAIERETLSVVGRLGGETSPWIINIEDLFQWHSNKPHNKGYRAKTRVILPDCDTITILLNTKKQIQIAEMFGVTKQAISAKIKQCRGDEE